MFEHNKKAMFVKDRRVRMENVVFRGLSAQTCEPKDTPEPRFKFLVEKPSEEVS